MARPAPLILLIEDEPQMRRFLGATLRAHEYQVVEAATAREGLTQAAGRHPDVILLDLGLPDGDGLDVARAIRRSAGTPIIVLSARGREHDKVTALDLGVDDYLTKPFGMPELLARVRVALRHAALRTDGAAEPVFTSGTLEVDLLRRHVRVDGAEVHLTPTEYKLLAALVRHAGRVVTHRHWRRCGVPIRRRIRTTCGSTWRSSGTSSSGIPRAPGCYSRSPESLPAEGTARVAVQAAHRAPGASRTLNFREQSRECFAGHGPAAVVII
jgi:two-component system KDP operon response regulator KdpE